MIYYYYGNVSIGIVPQIRIEIYAGLIIKSKFEEIYHILHTNLLILNTWQPSKFKSPTQSYYKHTSMKLVILTAERGLYKIAYITQIVPNSVSTI